MTEKIKLWQGDITTLKVDVIVNAANSALSGGGGVDGAIHRAAGPELLAACRKLGRCETGQSRITPGFNLPAEFVIHTVGPVWDGGERNEEILLKSCYETTLALADEASAKSIAFPAISCGVYRFPLDQAAPIALEAIANHLEQPHTSLCSVVLALFDSKTMAAYRNAYQSINLNDR